MVIQFVLVAVALLHISKNIEARVGNAGLTIQMACILMPTIRILFPTVVSRQSLAKASSTAEGSSPCLSHVNDRTFSTMPRSLTKEEDGSNKSQYHNSNGS